MGKSLLLWKIRKEGAVPQSGVHPLYDLFSMTMSGRSRLRFLLFHHGELCKRFPFEA